VTSWLRLSRREDAWKTAEILILRHQLAVLPSCPKGCRIATAAGLRAVQARIRVQLSEIHRMPSRSCQQLRPAPEPFPAVDRYIGLLGCCILLLYQALELRAQDFEFISLTWVELRGFEPRTSCMPCYGIVHFGLWLVVVLRYNRS
jgi:hypothetical protein